MDKVRTYVRLRRRQAELSSESDTIKEEADGIEQELLEEFATDGVQSMNVDGVTVYLNRQLWAGLEEGVSKSDAMEALRRAGLDHFISEAYNTSTLSGWLRDLEREDEQLPPELEGVIKSTERYSLRTRRS